MTSVAHRFEGSPAAELAGKDLLWFIAEGTAGTVGEEFFQCLVKHITLAFRADVGFVAELVPEDRERARFLACWEGDRLADPVEYRLAGTPCAEVRDSEVVSYTNGVRKRFPEDEMVVELGLDSYLAVALRGSDGAHLGHLGVLAAAPLVPDADKVAALRIFAARAASELERRGTNGRSASKRPRTESSPPNRRHCAASPLSSPPKRHNATCSTASPARSGCCSGPTWPASSAFTTAGRDRRRMERDARPLRADRRVRRRRPGDGDQAGRENGPAGARRRHPPGHRRRRGPARAGDPLLGRGPDQRRRATVGRGHGRQNARRNLPGRCRDTARRLRRTRRPGDRQRRGSRGAHRVTRPDRRGKRRRAPAHRTQPSRRRPAATRHARPLRAAAERQVRDHRAPRPWLAQASHELSETLQELRELARGIHPAVLTDHGLDAALKALAARTPLPVELVSTPGERLPQPVEATAYYIVAEALTNVAKYADAGAATVAVTCTDGRLLVQVEDDGVGGADMTRGSGLRGLDDRVAALRGILEVESVAGRGTAVKAVLPLDNE